jgi:cell division inhibitor SepF
VVEAQRFCIICQQEGFAQRGRNPIPMAISDTWHRALVYFGLAEEEDPRYESVPDRERERPRERERERVVDREPEAELEDRYRERPNVRRLQRRRRDEFDDIFADESPRDAGRETRVLRSVGDNGHAGMDQVHLVVPKAFNDAQEIANQFKDSIPVILNLQGVDPDLSKRLIDFSSGLTYALDGGMQRIADKVFLLTPRNVEVSAEERARLIEKGFFNQS